MSGPVILYALLFLMVAFWSGNYIAGKVALREFSPLLLAGLRIGFAGVMMAPVYAWERSRPAGKPAAARIGRPTTHRSADSNPRRQPSF